jgi:hypothetical protein
MFSSIEHTLLNCMLAKIWLKIWLPGHLESIRIHI